MVAEWFADGFSSQHHLILQADVSRRGTNLDGKGARGDVPLAMTVILALQATRGLAGIVTQLIGIELHTDCLGLARLERHAGKALQFQR